jgi:hypothetical protein
MKECKPCQKKKESNETIEQIRERRLRFLESERKRIQELKDKNKK